MTTRPGPAIGERPGVDGDALIRILFVTASYLPQSVGGTQLHLRDLVNCFNSDHEVRVLARANAPDDQEYALRSYEYAGITVHTINNTFRAAEDYFFLYSASGVDRTFEDLLDEYAPDLVHVHHLTCLSTNILTILRRREITTVMTLHDFWMICPRGQRLHRDGSHCEVIDRSRCHDCIRGTWGFLFPDGDPDADTLRAEAEMLAAWDDHIDRVLRGLDAIIVPSRFYRDQFAARGIDPKRISVIQHGMDHRPFLEARQERKKSDRTRIGFLGSVIPSKGVHVLLDAVKGLGDRVLVDIHGVSTPYHEDDGYLERLQAVVPEGVNVRFYGRYMPDDVPRILSEIDILVVPSIWFEAFGLTVREGFLAGIPVVASDIGALREAVGNDRGLLFRPGDPDDLRHQIVRLLDDPKLYERVRGRPEWVRPVDEMGADTMRVYEAAAKNARKRPPKRRDAFLNDYRDQVARVQEMSRGELLGEVTTKLEGLAERLGVDPAPIELVASLEKNTWMVRDHCRIVSTEADWLRGERASLLEEINRMREDVLERMQHFREEVSWLQENQETLLEERNAIKQERNRLSEEKETLFEEKESLFTEKETLFESKERLRREKETLFESKERLQREKTIFEKKLDELEDQLMGAVSDNKEAARHNRELKTLIEGLKAHMADLTGQVKDREELLSRLADSRFVRLIAKRKKIHELRGFFKQ